MVTTNTKSSSVDIRWKDYIPTPKRHLVYLWLGGMVVVGYLIYMIWQIYQHPASLTDQVYNTGVYLLLGVLLLLRGFRVHFLRHAWFIQMDELTIRYRMVLWSRARKVLWSDIVKIKVAFEEVYLYLKNGKTKRVDLQNVPDEDKVEEAKQAIITFGKQHSIPVSK